MSSLEIAELTGKRHPDVKRDIQSMTSELQEDVSIFARIYLDSMNRQQTEYLLDREHTECLLTGYSAKMRMAVIKRWHELEEGIHNANSALSNQEGESRKVELSNGAIIESLSGLQTEVKILKEMIQFWFM
ncbi:Rha family transcriptional regulator [Pseudomonas coronafaciens]|uniref:Rha family transcriptional regulator n=1 Tax=Pseudomonas coronafaciens TaxID=53409 RepID=UPI0039A1BF95